MIIFTARVKAMPGKETEAAEALMQMVASVDAQEPGAVAYLCHKVRNTPGMFLFYEAYKDQATCDAHMVTPHFGILKSLFGNLLDANYGVQVEDLDLVKGFMRM